MPPLDHWNSLLAAPTRPRCARADGAMRARRLRFGDRVLCPFLRPFFLDAADEARVAQVAETLWTLGERVAQAAIDSPEMLRSSRSATTEIRLARIDPGYATTSTAARADAFILPDSLQFAEYNGESPAGAGYSQGLAELFDDEPLMARFRERFDARFYRPVEALLEALVASYREWGGTASPPLMAIVDWREVPTFSEFEILRDAFTALGVPTIICDPRDLEYRSGPAQPEPASTRRPAHRPRLPPRPHQRHRRARSRVPRAAGRLRAARRLRGQLAALQDPAQEGVLRRAHRRASRRAVLGRGARHDPPAHPVDGRSSRSGPSRATDERSTCSRYLRAAARPVRHQAERRVRRHRRHAGMGNQRIGLGRRDCARARRARSRLGGAGADRGAPRGVSGLRRAAHRRCATRDMLVDFAPYIFRGRLAGFLTRLSATGLANVTSGGGQVPAFVVSQKSEVEVRT